MTDDDLVAKHQQLIEEHRQLQKEREDLRQRYLALVTEQMARAESVAQHER